MSGHRAQVSLEYMILLGGVIVIATAIYFVSKSLFLKGSEEANKTHESVTEGMENLFNKSQVGG